MAVGVEVKINTDVGTISDNLRRIGIANRKEKKLFPSCYLIVEDGKTYIAHFKELLKVNGVAESDIVRRDTIIWLLEKWGLLTAVDTSEVEIQKKKLFILTKEQLKNEKWSINHKWHYRTNNNIKEEN